MLGTLLLLIVLVAEFALPVALVIAIIRFLNRR